MRGSASVMTDWPKRLGRLSDRLRSVVGLTEREFGGRPRRSRPAEAPGASRPYPWEQAYPRGISWEFDVAPGTLVQLLDDAVQANAERTCLVFFGKKTRYRDLAELVRWTAKGLREIGVENGVRVGLFLPNSPYYVVFYHAILKAGGVVVNYNPLYAERGIARQIRNSDTRIMITMNLKTLYPKVVGRLQDTGLEQIVVCRMSAALPLNGNAFFTLFRRKEITAIPSDDRHVRFERLIANDGIAEFVPPAPGDIALFQYTGGTTGTPKAAMLTHASLYANTLQTRAWAPEIIEGEEKLLAVLPLFHVFGMTSVMNVGLHVGAEILLLPRFKVAEVLKAIDRDRPTVLMGVPTMFSAINGHDELDNYDLSSLNVCISGGAPLPVEIKNRFEALTGCSLVEGYGLTEAAPVCTINPIFGANKPGSAGLPIPGTVIEIMSLDDPDKPVPLGEKGEICIAGPQVMQGYLDQAEDNAATLRHGRLHTGDVGFLDADGYLFIIDRIKDLIITGGFNVYPRMVEDAIAKHPGVADVAVCGVPSAHHGEVVKAFVVKADTTLNAADIRGFLKDRLASFEMPRRIEFRKEIPKTMLGKPMRRELVEREIQRAANKKTAHGSDGDAQ